MFRIIRVFQLMFHYVYNPRGWLCRVKKPVIDMFT